MIKRIVPIILSAFILTSCKSKEIKNDKQFISVVSLIKKDVAHVDSSLYSIIKVEFTDTLHQDTSYIPREQFAAISKEFLETPDLSDKKIAKRWVESPAMIDQMLNRVIITYTPMNPDNEEFKKQEILATPVPGADAKINNIIIIREISNRDSFLQKKMLWQVNKSFQVVTISQKPGKPEIIKTTRVTWNEDPYQ